MRKKKSFLSVLISAITIFSLISPSAIYASEVLTDSNEQSVVMSNEATNPEINNEMNSGSGGGGFNSGTGGSLAGSSSSSSGDDAGDSGGTSSGDDSSTGDPSNDSQSTDTTDPDNQENNDGNQDEEQIQENPNQENSSPEAQEENSGSSEGSEGSGEGNGDDINSSTSTKENIELKKDSLLENESDINMSELSGEDMMLQIVRPPLASTTEDIMPLAVITNPVQVCVDDSWDGFANGTVVTESHNCPTDTWIIGQNATSTINEGISMVKTGGTVYVEDGLYYGLNTITKSLTLIGDPVASVGAGSFAPELRESADPDIDINGHGIGIAPGVDNVVIAGFAVYNFGVVGNNSSACIGAKNNTSDPSVNISILNNSIFNNDGLGIDLFNGGESIFRNVNIYANLINISLVGTVFDGSTQAIECANCSYSQIFNNTINGGRVGIGIVADNRRGPAYFMIDNVSVYSNTINNSETGISVYGTAVDPSLDVDFGNIYVSNNTINNPTRDSDELYTDSQGIAVYAVDQRSLARIDVNGRIYVQNNTINGDNTSKNTAGILVGIENVTVFSNIITEVRKGIVSTRLEESQTGPLSNIIISSNSIYNLVGWNATASSGTPYQGYPANAIQLGHEAGYYQGPDLESKVTSFRSFNGLDINRNNIYNTWGGIQLRGVQTDDGSDILIQGNSIRNLKASGIGIDSSKSIRIDKNYLGNNRYSGIFISSTGDALDNSQGNWHWYYEVSENKTFSPRDIHITGNDIDGNGYSSIPHSLDSQNKLNNGVSVIAGNASEIFINDCNTITDNGNFGVNNYTTQQLDASGNFWGYDALFPGQNINGNVLVSSYAMETTCVGGKITVDTLTTYDTTPELTGTVKYLVSSVGINVNGLNYPIIINSDATWVLPDNAISELVPGVYDIYAFGYDSLGNFVEDKTTNELTILSPIQDDEDDNGDDSDQSDGGPQKERTEGTTNEAETNIDKDDGEVEGVKDQLGLTCENTYKVGGRLYSDLNNDGDYDENEPKYGDVKVRIVYMNSDGKTAFTEVSTDENGYWSVTLCQGNYTIEIDKTTLPSGYSIEKESYEIVVDEDIYIDINIFAPDNSFFAQYWWLIILLVTVIAGGFYLWNKNRGVGK